jgi:3-deoxy-manno-octulosonate cytidylyltransferase (CMP-KDO synthetase)
MPVSTTAIIPARFASTRFPGKPLVMINGQSMIQRVYTQVSKAALVDDVIVATDDIRIFDHVISFGGKVMMTKDTHLSGTDRCAEVAANLPDDAWVVNVQGDEPFIQPQQIDLLVKTLQECPGGIATLAKQITEMEVLRNNNIVKAAIARSGEALYFSRHPIPFIRGVDIADWLQHGLHYKHIGLYGFQNKVLQQLAALPPGKLELAESLEQLRWLEHGFRIAVGITTVETIGIDTPEDLIRI